MIFSLSALSPHGTKKNGEICIKKSFMLSCIAPVSEQIMLFEADTRCEGASAKIFFRLMQPGREPPLYLSHTYTLRGAQQIGIPPVLWESITFEVCVTVPDGSALFVRDFEIFHPAKMPKADTVLRHNAHLGFLGIAPENTMTAFRLAALCGFSACICVPKVTKDGMFVCAHDTTINHAARFPDGRELDTDVFVKDLTYGELLSYDFGIRKGDVFRGTRIAKLEDFFALCQKTGMRPMFSTHPALTREQWLAVKEMLKRYELLPKFHVKAPDTGTLAGAFAVLGYEIDGYTLDVQKLEKDTIPQMLQTGISPARSRVGVEVRLSNLRDEDPAHIRAAGMFCAAWALPRSDFDEVYGRLISLGVSEVTEDHHVPVRGDF